MLKNLMFIVIIIIPSGQVLANERFSGFLRERFWIYETNPSSPIYLNKKQTDWKNIVTGNISFVKRWNYIKLRLETEFENSFLRNDESTELWLDEGYFNIAIPTLPFQLTVGRQKVDWGTGIIWNPTDVFNPKIKPFDSMENRKGIDLLRIGTHIEPFFFLYMIQYDDEFEDYYRHHSKLTTNMMGADIGLVFNTKKNKKNIFGAFISKYITDELEVHSEVAIQKGRDLPVPKFISFDRYMYVDEGMNSLFFSYIVGARYSISDRDILFLLEYYHNDIGLSHEQFKILLSGMNQLKENPELIPANKSFIEQTNRHLNELNPQRNYLFGSIKKSLNLNRLSINIEGLLSLDDLSCRAGPKIEYILKEDMKICFQTTFSWGNSNSEYGSGIFKNISLLELKSFF